MELVKDKSEKSLEKKDGVMCKSSLFKRSEDGLLDNIEYQYKDNNTIDWRRMVNPEHTVLNLQYKNELEQIHQKSVDQINVTEVQDKHLLILLAGFKELAQIRGYEKVMYKISVAGPDYVCTQCRIKWIPNFETGGRPIIFEALADASTLNTSGFGRDYLAAVAENRAFVRAVRNSLGVNVIGKDEIGTVNTSLKAKTVATEPQAVLETLLKERNKSFSKFKEEWVSLGNENAKTWTSVHDVPSSEIFAILEAVKKRK